MINIPLQHKKEKPRREKISIFLPGNSYKLHFKCEILPIDAQDQGIFFRNWGTFLKNGWGDLPPPASLLLRACAPCHPALFWLMVM